MKAKVQYNDYIGTTAADRSDYLEVNYLKMTEIIINKFNIPVRVDEYQYIGISVYGTDVNDVYATFFFKNVKTKEVAKYCKPSVKMQSVFDMFKRFEFQIGEHLDKIDRDSIKEIESIEKI